MAHNWNNGKMKYWARSEALALYWVSELHRIEKNHDP
jgi:hypothetical protein